VREERVRKAYSLAKHAVDTVSRQCNTVRDLNLSLAFGNLHLKHMLYLLSTLLLLLYLPTSVVDKL
jgi:hypothetical protein